MKDLKNIMIENAAMERKRGREFYHHFGIPLHNFWDYLTGFDIIKFDDYLKTPDGISTKDYLEQEYGPVACSLISELIGIKK